MELARERAAFVAERAKLQRELQEASARTRKANLQSGGSQGLQRSAKETLLSIDLGANETLLCVDLARNETLLSMELAAKETLLSIDLRPNETLLSMDLAPKETLLSNCYQWI